MPESGRDWRRAGKIHLPLVGLQVLAGTVSWTWYEWPFSKPVPQALASLWKEAGLLVPGAILLSLLVGEGIGGAMILTANHLRKIEREREEFREEMRQEALSKANETIQAWYRHEKANGNKFDEPPPTLGDPQK